MGSFEPTPEQRRAMEDRGGSLLVSAAAGSGKTKVLVERLFGYMERERCRIDDFLIITFTKAAAAELRGRIAAELSQRVARQPENMHLRRQMMRVYQADIKTVDAFCGSLLRENIHLLPPEGQRSLTPDFRVLDQQEAELLRMQMEPIAILAALGKELRRLYTARLALDGGKDRVWLKELWSMSSDYPAKLLLQAARNVDHDWCRQAVKRCQVLDRRMKSERNMDSEGELKLLLMELAGGR